jgi:hypothetical protein
MTPLHEEPVRVVGAIRVCGIIFRKKKWPFKSGYTDGLIGAERGTHSAGFGEIGR